MRSGTIDDNDAVSCEICLDDQVPAPTERCSRFLTLGFIEHFNAHNPFFSHYDGALKMELYTLWEEVPPFFKVMQVHSNFSLFWLRSHKSIVCGSYSTNPTLDDVINFTIPRMLFNRENAERDEATAKKYQELFDLDQCLKKDYLTSNLGDRPLPIRRSWIAYIAKVVCCYAKCPQIFEYVMMNFPEGTGEDSEERVRTKIQPFLELIELLCNRPFELNTQTLIDITNATDCSRDVLSTIVLTVVHFYGVCSFALGTGACLSSERETFRRSMSVRDLAAYPIDERILEAMRTVDGGEEEGKVISSDDSFRIEVTAESAAEDVLDGAVEFDELKEWWIRQFGDMPVTLPRKLPMNQYEHYDIQEVNNAAREIGNSESVRGVMEYMVGEIQYCCKMTDNTLGGNQNISTKSFRELIWFYVQGRLGLYRTGHDYSLLNCWMKKSVDDIKNVKTLARDVAISPWTVTEGLFKSLQWLTQDERIHIVLLAMEARAEGTLCYYLKGLMCM